MKKLSAFFYLLVQTSAVLAQKDSSTIFFVNANVIDGISTSPLLNRTVVISKGKITNIQTSDKTIPSNAVIVDLKGKWMLPGYIDAHVHFGTFDVARTALILGSTTVRTMHCDHFLDIQIRDAHRNGQKNLPDVVAAGYQIRPDMFTTFFEDFPELADMNGPVSGNENVRRVVRAMVSRGVDHIKFLATERSGTPDTDPRRRTFSDGEVAAIVDEARTAGLYAAAHAHGDEGAYAAVNAGVR